MCGIFGAVSNKSIDPGVISFLAKHACQRGKDSSGIMHHFEGQYLITKADTSLDKLIKKWGRQKTNCVVGHSRLITNGLFDNQPLLKNGISLFHNGIVVNSNQVFKKIQKRKTTKTDSEAILAIACDLISRGRNLQEISKKVLRDCKGTINCALVIPKAGKLLLFSNSGSMFFGIRGKDKIFSSEKYQLAKLKAKKIIQIWQTPKIISIPIGKKIVVKNEKTRNQNLIPILGKCSKEERLLKMPEPQLRRCSVCILPETMPFIDFDNQGVCNFCKNYELRNRPRDKQRFLELIEPYRKKTGPECIIPFSGGRDSCLGLHLVVKEFKMRPITYTYDWGMITDLGRRNISRMCAQLGVENIIVAADIAKKRRHIALNLEAWLTTPHLGMISILTAGDKHFFKYVETVKQQTGVQLTLWGINPLEVTHFKSGFLGVRPKFRETRVYMSGIRKQFEYQLLRLKAMIQNPKYFNISLWDSLSGEYFRSAMKKKDYYHIYDYWRWEEKATEKILAGYDWELAPDTKTTWRIGDGTAAFYNYIYFTVAGFTEHDTFRSNQIREGDLSRNEALELVREENRPRYKNIKWYLDAIGFSFENVIKKINSIPKIYKEK